LRLSPEVYGGRSLAAIGVACHEAGHAIQHARGFALLQLRSMMVPVTQLCSSLWLWVFMAGALLSAPGLMRIGARLLLAAAVFAIVTLPGEWDASRRAKIAMRNHQFLTMEENAGAAKVLNAAFLTYLAGAVTAVATFLYFAWRSGLLGGSRD
jgi:Zn-dependent membrane protease YugP